MSDTPAIRIGVDTGGTFTDLVLVDAHHRLRAAHKRLSTPDDPTRAVLEGIDHLLAQANQPAHSTQPPHVVHGSTVATNALLEHVSNSPDTPSTDPPRTAFITTAGFEDTLAIARQDRPQLYELVPHRPAPPIPREYCFGIHERIAHDGRVLHALPPADLDTLIEKLRAMNLQSIAVNLLHSYVNPAHEQQIAAALREAFGQSVHLTVSHELLPEYREYERAATCTINAVVAPRMVRYLNHLAQELGEDHLRIMASHGGTLPPEPIRRAPVRTTLSGPAGGVVGAVMVARAAKVQRIITLDMGGTSTDVALCEGAPTYTTENEAAGLPVRLPTVDMHTVGAGGGSIAWLDPGGALRVGPQSAGADPGPACYGRQTDAPLATVTDAHVVLGHIPADQPLGEGLRLDREAAITAVQHLARHAGLELLQTAVGILRVAEATMARAVQRISLQRGRDPRDYTLVPFGGAGGLHACHLAEALGMTRILVPTDPGVLSAVGMLGAAPRYMFSQAILLQLDPRHGQYDDPSQLPGLRETFAQLRQQADKAMANERLPADHRRDVRSVDMRYLGQSYEITVPFDEGDPIEYFLAEHQRLYGYMARDKPIEFVTVRWQTGGREHDIELPEIPKRTAPLSRREARDVPVYDGKYIRPWRHVHRQALRAGDMLNTPTIITEYSATTALPIGWSMTVNAIGQLMMERDAPNTPELLNTQRP